MTILPNPKERDVEAGRPSDDRKQGLFILASRLVRFNLDRRVGEAALFGDSQGVEEGFPEHPVVALGMVGRHEPFVGQEDIGSIPRELGFPMFG